MYIPCLEVFFFLFHYSYVQGKWFVALSLTQFNSWVNIFILGPCKCIMLLAVCGAKFCWFHGVTYEPTQENCFVLNYLWVQVNCVFIFICLFQQTKFYEYQQKMDDFHSSQKSCVSAINQQRRKLRDFQASLQRYGLCMELIMDVVLIISCINLFFVVSETLKSQRLIFHKHANIIN